MGRVYQIPKRMSKTISNIEMLVRLGIGFDKAATICGYSPEEAARIKTKMRSAMAFAEINYPAEDVGDDEVDITVSVGNDGLIRRKYD